MKQHSTLRYLVTLSISISLSACVVGDEGDLDIDDVTDADENANDDDFVPEGFQGGAWNDETHRTGMRDIFGNPNCYVDLYTGEIFNGEQVTVASYGYSCGQGSYLIVGRLEWDGAKFTMLDATGINDVNLPEITITSPASHYVYYARFCSQQGECAILQR